jgi:hypothetical protein
VAALNFLELGMKMFQADTERSLGKARAAQAGMDALELERDANQSQAEAQRIALAERRRARYIRSRALAVAGASGSGADDPTVRNVLDDIDTQGDTNFLNALYSGDFRAKKLRRSAEKLRRTGEAISVAAELGAASTAFEGVADFYNQNPTFFTKYGGQRAKQSVGTGTAYSDFSRSPISEWNV